MPPNKNFLFASWVKSGLVKNTTLAKLFIPLGILKLKIHLETRTPSFFRIILTCFREQNLLPFQ